MASRLSGGQDATERTEIATEQKEKDRHFRRDTVPAIFTRARLASGRRQGPFVSHFAIRALPSSLISILTVLEPLEMSTSSPDSSAIPSFIGTT
jgi:hypothetical protein